MNKNETRKTHKDELHKFMNEYNTANNHENKLYFLSMCQRVQYFLMSLNDVSFRLPVFLVKKRQYK